LITFQNTLQRIKDTANAEYLFWTGDSVPHDFAQVDQAEVTETLEAIT